MDVNTILTFMIIVALMIMSPGPNGALILRTLTIYDSKHAFINLSGFVSALYVHGTLSIFGLSAILVSSANLFFYIKMIGAIYIAYLGIKALISAFKDPNEIKIDHKNIKKRNANLRKAYVEGFLTNLLNPKLSIFYLAAFPQFVNFEQGAILDSYFLVFIHSILLISWFTFMIKFVNKTASKIKSRKKHVILQTTLGSFLLWFSYQIAALSSK